MVSPKTIPKNHINDRPEDQSFRQMFDQHSAVMLLVDPQTDLILEANSAAAKFYGCPQLCGKSINEINVLPSEQVLAERQKAKAEGRNTLILSQRLASGEERSVEELSSPFVWQHQQALFLIIRELSQTSPDAARQDELRQREIVLEDLHIYQVELEMQNQELRKTQADLEATQARYFDLYDLAPVGYCTLSKTGQILQANLTAANLFGVNRGKLVKRFISEFIKKESHGIYYLRRKQLLATGSPQAFEAQLMKTNGAPFWGLLEATLAQDDDGTPLFRMTISDITASKLIENRMKESETKFRLLFETMAEGASLYELITDRDNHAYDLRIVEVNAAFEHHTGLNPRGIIGKTVREVMPETKLSEIEVYFTVALTGKPLAFEYHSTRFNRYFRVHAFCPQAGHVATVLEDITERKHNEEKSQQLNAQLEQLAVTDYLTNLYNRRYFMQRGEEEFKRENRINQPLTLLMLDIDKFKHVNDAYGHAVGDQVLQQLATIFKSNLREIDILARLGGEEFAMLLPNTGLEEALLLAERVRQAVESTRINLLNGDVQLSVTISIGVTAYSEKMSTISDLLRKADKALYRAKHSGRNCVKAHQEKPPPHSGSGAAR